MREWHPKYAAAADRLCVSERKSGVSGNDFVGKKAAAASYFGCHSRIHAPIASKIGRPREDMMAVQNLQYLRNILIGG